MSTTGAQFTNTETINFAGAVQERYQHSDYFGTSTMQFFGARPTETVNVPFVDLDDAVNKIDGDEHNDLDSSMTGVDITLDIPIKSYNTVRKDQVDVRPDLQMLSRFGRQHGRNIGRGRTLRLANGLSAVAEAEGNIVEINQGASDKPAEIKDGIKSIATNFDVAGVDNDMRFGFMKSFWWHELFDRDSVISTDFGGQANRQTGGGNGSVINYLDFQIKNMGYAFGTDWSDSAYTALALPDASSSSVGYDQAHNMTDVLGIFWQGESWAVRHQTTLAVTAEWIPLRQIWLLMARLHMGFKVLQPSGLWVIREAS